MLPRFRLPIKAFVRFQSTLNVKNQPSTSIGVNTKIAAFDPIETPLPKSVQAVYFQPLRIPIKYGDLVADLQLRSYDHENLDFFCSFILRAGYYLGMPMTGPKPLPNRRERWTVIRSPFAQAKSKENFERRTHKRLIRVWDTNPEVVDLWLSYISKHSITGVGLKCNFFQREEINMSKSLENISFPELDKVKTMDEAVGEKVVELLNNAQFKKFL